MDEAKQKKMVQPSIPHKKRPRTINRIGPNIFLAHFNRIGTGEKRYSLLSSSNGRVAGYRLMPFIVS
jgi:hypothetical protein